MDLLRTLRADIARTYETLTGGRLRRILNCARTPGVQAAVVYRFGQWLRAAAIPARLVLEPVYYVLNALVQVLWGIELPREAQIGPGLRIVHFGGITISPWVLVGRNCAIAQNVTLGAEGHGDNYGAPVIGNDVFIGPGARVFGKITVGNNVKIGANAVVYRDVPNDAVVALDPGFRIISLKGNRRPAVARAA
jgi:serine O-acetyltransferase